MDLTCMQDLEEFNRLTSMARRFDRPENHLRNLTRQPGRFNDFSLATDELFFDYSRQRLDADVMGTLFSMARKTRALETFSRMDQGAVVNTTEQRAALHTRARDLNCLSLLPDQTDPAKELCRVNEQIRRFSSAVRSGSIKGSTGKMFTSAVIIGIGGSYLGCEFVYNALLTRQEPKVNLLFLSNVDIDNFGGIIKKIVPDTCLFIVVSKSYTTRETMANLEQVLLFLKQNRLSPRQHLVTITAKGSPGDDPASDCLESFHMFDFIGGRYSVTSAVGGLPLSLAFGFDVFDQFLKGCRQMDLHARDEAPEKNIPLTAALVSIWNIHFLNYPGQAIVPYASGLSKLAPHVQQLYMESLGKRVTRNGQLLARPGGCIIFGEPGTNAQHSFFQLAHQGPAFPVEFIGVVNPGFSGKSAYLDGVGNHQELWANLMAQTLALAIGREDDRPEKNFPGNRPSSVLVVNDLSPKSMGQILSFYEARTVLEGFILGLNPFDQFGVELGKKLAGSIREEIQARNAHPNHSFDFLDDTRQFYLKTLFAGAIPTQGSS